MNTLGQHLAAASILLGGSFGIAHADSISIDGETLKQVPSATVAQVIDFLERFVDSNRPIEEQLSLYANNVEYFGRDQVGKAEILRDMKRYRRQWPSRDYRISRIELIYPDTQSDRVYVRFEIKFTVFNATNSKRISGRGLYGAVIDDIDGTPQVASIQESVFVRKSSAEAED